MEGDKGHESQQQDHSRGVDIALVFRIDLPANDLLQKGGDQQREDAALRLGKERWQQRKEYKFFTCPACKTVLRVPKGEGKIKLVCRKCGTSFVKKS